MKSLIASLLVLAVWILPLVILLLATVLARRWFHRRDRRNPLTKGLLRGPGHTLREQLEDLQTDLLAYMAVGSAMPVVALALYLATEAWGGTTPTAARVPILVALAIGVVAFSVYKIVCLVEKARNLRLGLEAETAVGQELNLLMREGFAVFHDVSGDKAFNIDHVAVGRQGVFAIETKGRSKPILKDAPGHKVEFKDGSLLFPGWIETEPVAQAQRNAEWLRKWLTSAVGEPVEVKPVLMLPGWFVERKSSSDVAVMSANEPRAFFLKQRQVPLSDKLVQQIIHQLDARCRDVEVRAYVQAS
jgi:hypothetical protein